MIPALVIVPLRDLVPLPASTNTPLVAIVKVLPLPIAPLVHVIRPLRIPLVPASVAPARIALELVTLPFKVIVPLLHKLVPAPVSWPPELTVSLSEKRIVAPAAALNRPLLVPPPLKLSVPVSTSTVPVLLKATLLKVVVFVPADLRNKPALFPTGLPDRALRV